MAYELIPVHCELEGVSCQHTSLSSQAASIAVCEWQPAQYSVVARVRPSFSVALDVLEVQYIQCCGKGGLVGETKDSAGVGACVLATP